ncbi:MULTISPECIES: hypothetical protein [unclassified Microcoleus]
MLQKLRSKRLALLPSATNFPQKGAPLAICKFADSEKLDRENVRS